VGERGEVSSRPPDHLANFRLRVDLLKRIPLAHWLLIGCEVGADLQRCSALGQPAGRLACSATFRPRGLTAARVIARTVGNEPASRGNQLIAEGLASRRVSAKRSSPTSRHCLHAFGPPLHPSSGQTASFALNFNHLWSSRVTPLIRPTNNATRLDTPRESSYG